MRLIFCAATHVPGVRLSPTDPQHCISQDSLETRDDGKVICYEGDFRRAYQYELDSPTLAAALPLHQKAKEAELYQRMMAATEEEQQMFRPASSRDGHTRQHWFSRGALFLPGLPERCLLLSGSLFPY